MSRRSRSGDRGRALDRRSGRCSILLLAAVALGWSPAWAREWRIVEGSPPTLRETIAVAAPGDRIVVDGGSHAGPLLIGKSLELVGVGWPAIEGNGEGTVISVRSPNVGISGFVIRDSGASLDEENSGVTVDESPGTEIVGNRFEDVLFGVYVRKSPASVVAENQIDGKRLDVPRRGDAIRVWYSDGVRIEGNRVTDSRDVVLWYSKQLTVRGNSVSGGRYGLHFMYCDDALIEENLLRKNSVGAFLMYSRRLRLSHNTILGNHGPSGFGVGLKDMDDAVVRENHFVGNRVGVFLDNSPREAGSTIEVGGNLIAGNDIGVSLLPNVRSGRFEGNSFDENQQHVEIAGAGGDPRANLWNGNFWSDYSGYDGDGDGFGETEYRADRLFEDLSDRQPVLRLFLYSPAKDALELAARTMPLIRPRPRIIDANPRMSARKVPGCPEWVPPGRDRFGRLGAGLLAFAGLILLAPAARLTRASSGSDPSAETTAGRLSKESNDKPLISLREVSKIFGQRAALDGVSCEIGQGEAVAIWGPNGAGKTTLLRILLGVIPSQGEIRVDGADPWRQGKAVRCRMGFVPQEISLQGEMTVVETIEFFATLRRVPAEGVPDLLSRLGLEDELEKRVGALSGGQRQRLALALALLPDPAILVLDEPTANLDARTRADFIELLRELKGSGRTLVFSSHRPEEVQAVADRVLHLENGRHIADARPSAATLNGHRTAELWLRVKAEEMAVAEKALVSAGFQSRRLGSHLVVEVAAGRKLEPIRELLKRDVGLESFEVDVADGSGERDEK